MFLVPAAGVSRLLGGRNVAHENAFMRMCEKNRTAALVFLISIETILAFGWEKPYTGRYQK